MQSPAGASVRWDRSLARRVDIGEAMGQSDVVGSM